MSHTSVSVTGSSRVTGGFAILSLLRMGVPVRAIVRKDDERAARLREIGRELLHGLS